LGPPEDAPSRKVKLPKGKWETSTGKIVKGGRTFDFEVTLDELLFFVKND